VDRTGVLRLSSVRTWNIQSFGERIDAVSAKKAWEWFEAGALPCERNFQPLPLGDLAEIIGNEASVQLSRMPEARKVWEEILRGISAALASGGAKGSFFASSKRVSFFFFGNSIQKRRREKWNPRQSSKVSGERRGFRHGPSNWQDSSTRTLRIEVFCTGLAPAGLTATPERRWPHVGLTTGGLGGQFPEPHAAERLHLDRHAEKKAFRPSVSRASSEFLARPAKDQGLKQFPVFRGFKKSVRRAAIASQELAGPRPV